MAPDRLRKHLHEVPFSPFSVEIPGGRRFRIRHPDYAVLSPTGRTLIVHPDDTDDYEVIDVFLISNLSVEGGSQPAPA
jgi:hypothetical protein